MSSVLLEEIVAGRAPAMLTLNVQQYHEMLAAGILREGERVELIDGVLVRKDRRDAGDDLMVHGPRHASVVARVQRILDRAVEPFGCHARGQLPTTLRAANPCNSRWANWVWWR